MSLKSLSCRHPEFNYYCLAIALSALSNVKICDRKNEDRINDHRIGCKKTIVTFSWTTKLKTKANEVTNDALASPKTHTSGGTCQRCDACSTTVALWRQYEVNGLINKKTVKSKNRYLFAH